MSWRAYEGSIRRACGCRKDETYLVIDGLVQVLDEDVASTALAQVGVALRPHDAARAALDLGIVELLKSALTIGGGVVVDVGISKRTTGDGITADANANREGTRRNRRGRRRKR